MPLQAAMRRIFSKLRAVKNLSQQKDEISEENGPTGAFARFADLPTEIRLKIVSQSILDIPVVTAVHILYFVLDISLCDFRC